MQKPTSGLWFPFPKKKHARKSLPFYEPHRVAISLRTDSSNSQWTSREMHLDCQDLRQLLTSMKMPMDFTPKGQCFKLELLASNDHPNQGKIFNAPFHLFCLKLILCLKILAAVLMTAEPQECKNKSSFILMSGSHYILSVHLHRKPSFIEGLIHTYSFKLLYIY